MPINQGVNYDLLKWAKKSSLVKKALGNIDPKWLDDSISSFFLDKEDKREIIAVELYKKMWGAHNIFGPLPPIVLLQEFEHNRVFYEDYRDHTTHSLITCFLGLYIFENNKTIRDAVSKFISKRWSNLHHSCEDVFLYTWLMASLYHDIGYLVENHKIDSPNSKEFNSIKREINKLLSTPLATTPAFSTKNINTGKESEFINRNKVFVPSIISIDNIEASEYFSELLEASIYTNLAPTNYNGIEKYYIFAKSHKPKNRDSSFRDHGISSALLLLHIWHSYSDYLERLSSIKGLDDWYNDAAEEIRTLNKQLKNISPIVVAAAQAISLHNISRTIWEENDAFGNKIDLQSFKISLNDDGIGMPIAFLLRLSDELQVWDRPRFRAPSINDTMLHSDDLSITVSDEGVFVRFFSDDKTFIHPEEYKDGNYLKLKNQLDIYLKSEDIFSILRYGSTNNIDTLNADSANPITRGLPESKEVKMIAHRKEAKLAKESNGAYRFVYNNGSFNIYLSKAKASDILSPHKHECMDEVSIITAGSAYVCIENNATALNTDEAILLPAGNLHEFIPRTYPCEFLTMGNEDELNHVYKTNWDRSFADLDELEQRLNEANDEESLDIYKRIVGYLESEIMEVRWRAAEILKQYLAIDGEQGVDVNSLITATVQNKLRSELIENKIAGISMACGFRSLISANMIHKIMTSQEYFMLPWICTYYILDNDKNYDFEKMFGKVRHSGSYDEASSQELCIYYDRVLISVLQLIKKNKDNLMCAIIHNDVPFQPKNVIPVDEIVLHFVLWDTSRRLEADAIDFSSVEKKISEKTKAGGERILRGMLNFDHEEERFRILDQCRKQGILFDVVNIYYSSIKRNGITSMNEVDYRKAKERIKNYLRILVTEQCNLNCVYCHREGRHPGLNAQVVGSNKDFDLRAVLQVAKESGITKVKVSGGEPLLYPNILGICHDYQDSFSDIGFTTNGIELLRLKKQLSDLPKKNLSFNVTLNSLEESKYKEITGSKATLEDVIAGIDLLLELGYSVKINSVITSYNFEDIDSLVMFAAKRKIDIKLLDLFTVSGTPDAFQRISIAEIKNKIMALYRLNNCDFYSVNDYLCANVLGIRVLLPQRVYSIDCQYNCPMYPCAEGLFGIRVYEDYSCSQCFKDGELHRGGLNSLKDNIESIRKTIEATRMGF